MAVVPTLINIDNFPGIAATGEAKFPIYSGAHARVARDVASANQAGLGGRECRSTRVLTPSVAQCTMAWCERDSGARRRRHSRRRGHSADRPGARREWLGAPWLGRGARRQISSCMKLTPGLILRRSRSRSGSCCAAQWLPDPTVITDRWRRVNSLPGTSVASLLWHACSLRRQRTSPRWYQDVVRQRPSWPTTDRFAALWSFGPDGYAIWERMQAEMDAWIKDAGARECLLPPVHPGVIPRTGKQSTSRASARNFAVVTHAGGKALDEPIIVRPTSETVIGEFMAKWVNSYRGSSLAAQPMGERRPMGAPAADLPAYHRIPVAKRVTPRTRRMKRARAYARRILLEVYTDFMVREYWRIPVVVGRKTAAERFAGAINTTALRGHDARRQGVANGDVARARSEFRARAFNIEFSGADGRRSLAWTTSWGSSRPDGRGSHHGCTATTTGCGYRRRSRRSR